MTKLRNFLAGLLLVPVLTLNASPLQTDADVGVSSRGRDRIVLGLLEGRWIVIPC